jgi:hypothetical protein
MPSYAQPHQVTAGAAVSCVVCNPPACKGPTPKCMGAAADACTHGRQRAAQAARQLYATRTARRAHHQTTCHTCTQETQPNQPQHAQPQPLVHLHTTHTVRMALPTNHKDQCVATTCANGVSTQRHPLQQACTWVTQPCCTVSSPPLCCQEHAGQCQGDYPQEGVAKVA